MSATAAAVTLRAAVATDCKRVWLWRNDEETRLASFDSSPITFETHERWFLESLQKRDRRIYVVVAAGEPSGVVRLDIAERQAAVSIHLAPERRGQGVGPIALRALDRLAWSELGLECLVASVRPENYASLSAFKKAGFRAAPPTGPVVTLTKLRPEGGG